MGIRWASWKLPGRIFKYLGDDQPKHHLPQVRLPPIYFNENTRKDRGVLQLGLTAERQHRPSLGSKASVESKCHHDLMGRNASKRQKLPSIQLSLSCWNSPLTSCFKSKGLFLRLRNHHILSEDNKKSANYLCSESSQAYWWLLPGSVIKNRSIVCRYTSSLPLKDSFSSNKSMVAQHSLTDYMLILWSNPFDLKKIPQKKKRPTFPF